MRDDIEQIYRKEEKIVMAENTEISWTDSTFNPWWGCSNVSPGCYHCYAQRLDRRMGGDHWGTGKMYRLLGDENWKKPLRWNANQDGLPHRVFCGSMCDWADKHAPEGQRERLFDLIKATPRLDWQLLTKRATLIKDSLPDDWGDGYPNVWLGVTVENKQHGIPRIDHLRQIPARVRFLSVEPLLEDLGDINLNGIHWVIVGGESGPGARQMKDEWVFNIEDQCKKAGVAFFFKQWGGTRDKGGCLLRGFERKEWPFRR